MWIETVLWHHTNSLAFFLINRLEFLLKIPIQTLEVTLNLAWKDIIVLQYSELSERISLEANNDLISPDSKSSSTSPVSDDLKSGILGSSSFSNLLWKDQSPNG